MRGCFSIGILSVVLLAVGCNTAQPTVNRVQPNVVEKKTFEGEWYVLQTVIDTPYSAGYTFVGEQGSMEKVKWEIQENYLIARRSFEFIAGSEPQGISGESEQDAPVAVYKIDSHFDIRRDYNSVTGEELNVVGENTTDRPWNERKYMRVDWSQNLVTDTNFLMLARIFDGIESEPVSYYVQDLEEGHPHRPKFEHKDGSKEVNYIDIVNKMFVKPTTVDIDGLGKVPSCLLLYKSHLDCSSGEITVRNSFLKVDPKRDYQPFEYTGDRMEKFGYFVTTRAGYDPQYGVVEPSRYRFANRHNIWQQSHVVGEDGNYKTCFADSECAGGGSICDLDYAKAARLETADSKPFGLCTIPYRDREIRPIAYHVSPNFPENLWPDAQHLVDQWNGAFVETVSSLREQECQTAVAKPVAGGDGSDGGVQAGATDANKNCAEERKREDHQHIFVLCHNPVVEGDNEACGGEGTSAQIGDLRYSMIGWVNDPHLSSPLGYGPSAADPQTGEIVMANAFVYGAGIETLTASARDTIALLNGDLDQAEITSGDYIEAWVKNQKAPGSDKTGRPMDDHIVKVDGSNVARINKAMDFSWARARGLSQGGTIPAPTSIAEGLERMDSSRQALFNGGAFGNGTGGGVARLQSLAGTDIEKMLTGPEMMLAAGIFPDTSKPIDEETLEAASPLRGMDPAARQAMARARDRIQEKACLVYADFADDGLLGLARTIQKAVKDGNGTLSWYGNKYEVGKKGELDYEAVREMLRHPIFDAVTAHEVGHTVGLRHNFSGSADAWNYSPEYWALRDDGNMQPRYLDPMTPTEIDGRIREFQYSTVMDYGNNFVVTDANGIGHYDHAAIKMGYGDLVEVFDDVTPAQAGDVDWVNFIQGAGWPVPLKEAAFTSGQASAYAYTDFPSLVGGIGGLEKRADVPYRSLKADAHLAAQGLSEPLQDSKGRPAVPYLFCSDEQADLGPDCFKYDAGADAYESLQSVMDSYYNYYIFAAYSRGRLGFNLDDYFDRVTNRYFAKLEHANQIYALYRGVFEDVFSGVIDFTTFYERPDGMGAWTAGVGASYQMLTQVVTTPEPGGYNIATLGDGTSGYEKANIGAGTVSVDAFYGRPLETAWDQSLGYYWFDQIDRAGYFYDKVGALMTLVDPRSNFLGRDTSADLRKYSLSFYTSFGPSMTSFLRGVQGEDWQTIGPRAKEGDSTGLVFPDPLSLTEQNMAGTPIDPSTSFSIQLYAAVFSLGLIPETYDERYINNARIFVKGSPNGVDLAEGTPRVEFVDSETGLTYVAASYVVDAKETGVGAQMINHANALKFRGETTELRQFVGNLDLAHRLGWHFTFGN